MLAAGTRAFLEGPVRHHGNGRLRPGRRPCRRFSRPAPGATALSDVRIFLPGYRDVVEQFTHIQIVGQCAGAWRRCRPARSGWPRPGTACRSMSCCARNFTTGPAIPMATNRAGTGPTTTSGFGRFASAAAQLAAGSLDKNWAADLVHANDWQAALVPAYLAWNAVKIPTILTIHNLAYQGLFPKESLRRIGAPARFLPYRRPRILRQTVLPQGRHRLRLASDHRQRDLCQGDHHAGTRLRARGPAPPPLRRRATDRHPERHRRKLGPARLRATGAAVRRRRLGRQARQLRLRPPAIRTGAVARTDLRPGRAAGSPEGHRSRAGGRRRDHRCRRPDHRHRQRRTRHRAGAGRCAPPPAGCDRRRHRLQ